MMRLLRLSIGILALGLVLPASAADLPRKAPAPAVVAPVFNWTGFYIGGHVGYGWGREEATFVAPTIFFPTGTVFGADVDGFLGGGQVGFNWQTGMWVLGVEGQFSWTNADESVSIPSLFIPGAIGIGVADYKWHGTAAVRVGIASANWLFYGKGGVAFLDADYTSSVNVLGVLLANTINDTRVGWMAGAGIEYGFTPNWSVKVEYNYMDFGSDRFNFVVAGIANPVDIDTHIHVVKAGINYRFGAWR